MKKNYKPLYILGIFILLFGVFFWLISRPSQLDRFNNELKNCNSYDCTKETYLKYKDDLTNEPNFINEVTKKLEFLSLTEDKKNDVWTWLPINGEYLNLIVVPDLSRRLIHIPNQPNDDKELINTIYEEFGRVVTEKAKQSNNYLSKDRLVVEVSDKSAAKGQFSGLANKLLIDLETKKQPYWKYFDNHKNTFKDLIDELYQLGLSKPLGADYWKYFKEYLKSNQRRASFRERYRNVLIILTDGYLETENKNYTKMSRIESTNQDNHNWEVLVLEVSERNSGDYDVLKQKWQDWFYDMNIQIDDNSFFQQKMNASHKVKNIIREFLNKKNANNQIAYQIKKSDSCQDTYTALIREVTKSLDARNTFTQMQMAKKGLQNVSTIKSKCKVKKIKEEVTLTETIFQLQKSSENLLKQDPNDKDFQERAKFYKELANLISDAP
ncbi:MAG: hypothetical protein MUF58_20930 [Arcicella sp.]|jgi:hypothetical protein|nr:hypothetical protein [Arcicella sp.]